MKIQIAWSNQLSDKISDMSAILWHRLNPYVQILLQRKMQNAIQGQLFQIQSITEPVDVMVGKYLKCFDTWIDSEKISFNTNNISSLQQLSMKDYFILQFFTMGTCTRKRGDNCLMIGITGKSSVGKSTLFEAQLAEILHIYVNDRGTGRFKEDIKTILFFHDMDVKTSMYSKDRGVIKTICRSEPTVVKVHSSIISVPPVHLFYTSNTNLFNHAVKGGNSFSSADIVTNIKNKEHINSMRHRFSECYCPSKPPLDPCWFPECGMFQRQYMILGIYERVVAIMESYSGPEIFTKMSNRIIY